MPGKGGARAGRTPPRSANGFKAMVDSLTCVLHCLCAIEYPPLVQQLLISCWLVCQLGHFNSYTCVQALVGLESRIKHAAA